MASKKVFLVSDEPAPLKALLGRMVAEELEVEVTSMEVYELLHEVHALKQELDRKELEIKELRLQLGEMEGMPDFLLNIRTLTQELDREVSRSERYQQPVSVLYVQVDKPELIEERLGAQGLHDTQVQLAELVRRVLRKSDVVAKVDGITLAIILPQTDSTGSVAVAEKVRSQVEPYQFTGLADHPLSVSVGVVTFPRYGILNGEDLMRLCAYTITHAIRDGGNQVSVA